MSQVNLVVRFQAHPVRVVNTVFNYCHLNMLRSADGKLYSDLEKTAYMAILDCHNLDCLEQRQAFKLLLIGALFEKSRLHPEAFLRLVMEMIPSGRPSTVDLLHDSDLLPDSHKLIKEQNVPFTWSTGLTRLAVDLGARAIDLFPLDASQLNDIGRQILSNPVRDRDADSWFTGEAAMQLAQLSTMQSRTNIFIGKNEPQPRAVGIPSVNDLRCVAVARKGLGLLDKPFSVWGQGEEFRMRVFEINTSAEVQPLQDADKAQVILVDY